MRTAQKSIRAILLSWYTHGALKEGAALSFYTVLALPPLFIAMATLASFMFDPNMIERNLLHSSAFLLGQTATSLIEITIHSISATTHFTFKNGWNLFILFILASGIFWQLQDSLNTILGHTSKKQNFIDFLLNQISLIFLVGVLCILFLATTFMDSIFSYFPQFPFNYLSKLSYLMSLGTFFGAMAFLFKFLPAQKLTWRAALFGSFITTLLFQIGKYFLVIYISSLTISSTYGAASSVIAILLWVYYSSQTIFLGAESIRAIQKN